MPHRPIRPLRLLTTALAALAITAGVLASTGAAPANAAGVADIKINEIESAPSGQGNDVRDWVELINTGTVTVDASGLVLRGNRNSTGAGFVLPTGSTLAPGARRTFDVDVDVAGGFVLDNADTLRLQSEVTGTVTLLDSYSWTSAATTTYGRCPEGTGTFATTLQPTKGAANACPTTTPTPTPTPTPAPPPSAAKDTTPPTVVALGVKDGKFYASRPPALTCVASDTAGDASCAVQLKIQRTEGQRLKIVGIIKALDLALNAAKTKVTFSTTVTTKQLPNVKDPSPNNQLVTVLGIKDGKTYANPPKPGCSTLGNPAIDSCSVSVLFTHVGLVKRDIARALAVVRGFDAAGKLVDTTTKTFTTKLP